MAKKTPSRWSRLARLGGLTGRVTRSYVADKVRSAISGTEIATRTRDRLHLDNARDLVETMSTLKGAAMKVGQQVAMLADAIELPEDISKTLGQLHSQASAAPFEQIREDIEAELECSLQDAFSDFQTEPIGTASLAQAHAATLHDGRDVVVKVLHRGVAASVDTDLMALKGILMSSRVLRRSRAELDDIFDEMRDRLHEELDYLHEAANIHAYTQMYGDDPRLRMPKVHVQFSTERVLTMDRLPGKHIDEFLREASAEARQRAGRTITEFYYEQVFRHRTLHADPHPGNYLFEPDGRVGVLDFGCVKRFDEFWIGTYARAALAVIDGDRDATISLCRDLGAWRGHDPQAAEALWRFVEAIGHGFASGEVTLGSEDEQYLEDMKPVIKELMRFPEIRAPRDVIMLHRSMGGLYTMGRKLKTRADFGALLREHATHAIHRADGH